MDAYIRDFHLNTVDTEIANNVKSCNNLFFKTIHPDFKVIHMNIRSINKNLDEFKILLDKLDPEFDCIILSETWLIDDLNIFNMQGYSLIYNEGNINQNDGLVIYVKNTLSYRYNVSNIGTVKALELYLRYQNENILITGVYRPPSTCQIQFLNDLRTYFENCTKNNYLHVFVGDINTNILQNSDVSNEYLNLMYEMRFISTINVETRLQNNSGSCIDHLFVQQKYDENKINPIVLQSTVTDHFSLVLQIEFPKLPQNDKNNFLIKTYINKPKLIENLKRENWQDVYSENDVNESSNVFLDKIKTYILNNTKSTKIKQTKTKLGFQTA